MGARSIWEPAADAWATSRLADFAVDVLAAGGPRCDDYRELLRWSLDDPGAFWSALARWGGVHWHTEPERALGSTAMPGAQWFPGATLNYAEAALQHAPRAGDDIALVGVSATRDRIEMSWTQLVEQVARCRAGLVALGVGRGDRVVAFMPTIPETTVAFLATVSLGAIWSTCAPEFGVRAVIDRWQQIEPKVLFTIDGYFHGDRPIDRADHVVAIVEGLPTLDAVIRLPYLDPTAPDDWTTLLATAPSGVGVEVEPVPFDHPLYILFSSGTTGLPKPIVHGHGGITIEHLKALALHYDLAPGDRFSWFTTTGWMMWNFLASTSLVGATTVLFDGDPGWPDLSTLWALAADEHLDVLGVSAPFIMACRKAGLRPGEHHDLSNLRHLGSTGAPSPRGLRMDLRGGGAACRSDHSAAAPTCARDSSARRPPCPSGSASSPPACSAATSGRSGPTAPSASPARPGSWSSPSPCRRCRWVSGVTTTGIDTADAYFAEFPGVWRHGDWITFDADGGSVISGRSDATLNRGGVRLGTSDFYTVVEAHPAITDSVVVHLEDPDGDGPGELILFVATATPNRLDDALRDELRRTLRTELSPRHVPDLIVEIPSVPRTLSGKKLEVPVKRLLLGAAVDEVASRDSLSDPMSLDYIERWLATERE